MIESKIREILVSMNKSQRKDMAYLIINMPDFDRNGIDLELLKENVEYANIAREQFAWAQQLPEESTQNNPFL